MKTEIKGRQKLFKFSDLILNEEKKVKQKKNFDCILCFFCLVREPENIFGTLFHQENCIIIRGMV